MVVVKNECVGCRSLGLPCIGAACRNRNVPHLCCDSCGGEDQLYEFEGQQLCIDCVENRLQKVLA